MIGPIGIIVISQVHCFPISWRGECLVVVVVVASGGGGSGCHWMHCYCLIHFLLLLLCSMFCSSSSRNSQCSDYDECECCECFVSCCQHGSSGSTMFAGVERKD
jgi:hypothetical protein